MNVQPWKLSFIINGYLGSYWSLKTSYWDYVSHICYSILQVLNFCMFSCWSVLCVFNLPGSQKQLSFWDLGWLCLVAHYLCSTICFHSFVTDIVHSFSTGAISRYWTSSSDCIQGGKIRIESVFSMFCQQVRSLRMYWIFAQESRISARTDVLGRNNTYSNGLISKSIPIVRGHSDHFHLEQ